MHRVHCRGVHTPRPGRRSPLFGRANWPAYFLLNFISHAYAARERYNNAYLLVYSLWFSTYRLRLRAIAVIRRRWRIVSNTVAIQRGDIGREVTVEITGGSLCYPRTRFSIYSAAKMLTNQPTNKHDGSHYIPAMVTNVTTERARMIKITIHSGFLAEARFKDWKGASKGIPGDAKCVTEILGGQKWGSWGQHSSSWAFHSSTSISVE